MTSAFISKPSGGWIHSDKLISREGATYAIRVSDTKTSQYCLCANEVLCDVQYVGCLEVKVSMKELDFKTRSCVAK